MFKKITEYFNKDWKEAPEDSYLNGAVDIYDLESRMKTLQDQHSNYYPGKTGAESFFK